MPFAGAIGFAVVSAVANGSFGVFAKLKPVQDAEVYFSTPSLKRGGSVCVTHTDHYWYWYCLFRGFCSNVWCTQQQIFAECIEVTNILRMHARTSFLSHGHQSMQARSIYSASIVPGQEYTLNLLSQRMLSICLICESNCCGAAGPVAAI